jgi:glycosyltransferase involved in cell wall biosynthesis
MKIGLVIYGSLNIISGGYLFDRMLVDHLRTQGDVVDVISLPLGNYAGHLLNNLIFRLPQHYELILEDELSHASLLRCNGERHASPIVSIVHNLHSSERRSEWKSRLYRKIERSYLDSVDGFIFNSEVSRRAVESLSPNAKPHVIAPPGGDRFGEITPEEISRRALGGGPLRLLFLANVTAGKGLEIALDALALLPKNEYVLDVVGSCSVESNYSSRMRRKAHALWLPVRFWNVLEGEALVKRLKQAQLMVLPSFYEGFGISFLEGMAHGLPAIGTTAGAIPDLVVEGENGYLIRPGDSNHLARHLSRLRADRALLARLGICALRSFRRRPTWRQSTGLIRKFLEGMIVGRDLAHD